MTGIPDALVVGGGLAGGALATALASAGRKVVLFEREAGQHHKVCGEFLSREAVLYLAALGIDPLALGASRIHSLRLFSGHRLATVELPFPALSLSRRVLDRALLDRAAYAGADIRLGARVQSLEFVAGDWQVRLAGGETWTARSAFLATGKHDLRGWPRPSGMQSDLIGFKMHFRLPPEQVAVLAGHVELTLFPGGYAGLELVEHGVANLCLLVKRTRFEALGQQWDALLDNIAQGCRHFGERLQGAVPCWDRPLAVASIPYGYVRSKSDGIWRLGDQSAVIPSFSGDGMSIALHSARVAAACYLGGSSTSFYQRQIAHDVAIPVRCATLLSMLCVNPVGKKLIGWGAERLPSLMSVVAAATRVPSGALRRTGLDFV